MKCGLASTFMFNAAGQCTKNHCPMVCLQDPILVSGNICLRSATENWNLQGAFVLPHFTHIAVDQILNKTKSTIFLSYADRASQYNLSN